MNGFETVRSRRKGATRPSMRQDSRPVWPAQGTASGARASGQMAMRNRRNANLKVTLWFDAYFHSMF